MHIRVTRGRLDPARFDELAGVARETVAGAGELPGCRGFQIAADRSSGRLIAVSLWDDPAQAQAIGRLRAPAEAVGVQFEPPEMYEVIAQT
jgi:quinol monooxygenase YgiN